MRNLVLLLTLVVPMLAACGSASARTPAEIGKPICAHYDDAGKHTPGTSGMSAMTPAANSTTAIASAATSPAATAATGGGQMRNGGSAGFAHPHNAPRWQTFLPGMFK